MTPPQRGDIFEVKIGKFMYLNLFFFSPGHRSDKLHIYIVSITKERSTEYVKKLDPYSHGYCARLWLNKSAVKGCTF